MDINNAATGVANNAISNMNNVDTGAIDLAIEYMEENFTKPLIHTGENILDSYESVGQALKSETITRSIQAQRYRISNLKANLESIFAKARGNMEDSNAEIKKEQAIIDDEITE